MRILFLSTWWPYPPDHGSRIRAYNLLKTLSACHEVTLVSFMPSEKDRLYLPVLEGMCQQVIPVAHNPFAYPRLRSVVGFATLQPRSFFAGYSDKMQRVVKQVAREHQFDLLISEVIVAALYGKHIDGLPKVLEDLEVTQFLETATSDSGWVAQKRRQFANYKFTRCLGDLLKHYNAFTVPSSQEERSVVSLVKGFEGRCAVIPNGIEEERYKDVVPIKGRLPYLVFNGALTFSANFEAMRFFLADIWPQIEERVPNLLLKITGSYDGVDLDRLAFTPRVQMTGYLGDVLPTVAGSSVCVVPLLSGGGTRLKVLEAMALGVPVVATPKAVEGLDLVHGKHVLIADTTKDFAEAVVRILDDPDLKCSLCKAAYALVHEQYTWTHIGQDFNALIQSIAGC